MRDSDRKPQRVLGSLVGVMLVLLLAVGISVDRKPAHAVAASVTLANSNAGSATAITFEFTITTMSLVSNIFYLSKPASYPNFPSLNSAALTPLTTVWVNGTLRNTTEFLNINGTWSSGIQIWAQSGKFAAGDTIKLHFAEGIVTNPATSQTATWSWRTAQGSGATVESFSATATVTGGTTTTTSTTTTTTTSTTTTTTTTTVPPTTTTTTSTTLPPTTTTTMPPTTTTAAPTTTTTTTTTAAPTTTVPLTTVPATTTTVAGSSTQNRPAVTTTTPPVSTTVAQSLVNATTTTLMATTTTTSLPANPPVDEETVSANGGKPSALVDGKEQAVETSVSDANVRLNAGQVAVDMSAKNSDGKAITPSLDGRYSLSKGSELSLGATGFAPGSSVEIWLYSEPMLLEIAVADSSGRVPFTIKVSDEMESGDHHLVLSGQSYAGDDVSIATPLTILGNSENGVIARVSSTIVWILLGSALIIGLAVPTTLRRRKAVVRK